MFIRHFSTSVWTTTGDWLHPGYQGALLSAMIHYGRIYGDATLAVIPSATVGVLHTAPFVLSGTATLRAGG